MKRRLPATSLPRHGSSSPLRVFRAGLLPAAQTPVPRQAEVHARPTPTARKSRCATGAAANHSARVHSPALTCLASRGR